MTITLNGTTGITTPAETVNGNETITGDLSVGGNSTVTGNQTITGNLTVTGTITGAVGLGVGQTWQNMARSYSTTYTNSTGKPIMVSIFASNTSAAPATCRFYVGGVAIGGFGMSQSGGIDNGGSFVVPSGSTYYVTNNNFSAPTWYELR
jgi:hypothetical protein